MDNELHLVAIAIEDLIERLEQANHLLGHHVVGLIRRLRPDVFNDDLDAALPGLRVIPDPDRLRRPRIDPLGVDTIDDVLVASEHERRLVQTVGVDFRCALAGHSRRPGGRQHRRCANDHGSRAN
jgi:hypothetical protein